MTQPLSLFLCLSPSSFLLYMGLSLHHIGTHAVTDIHKHTPFHSVLNGLWHHTHLQKRISVGCVNVRTQTDEHKLWQIVSLESKKKHQGLRIYGHVANSELTSSKGHESFCYILCRHTLCSFLFFLSILVRTEQKQIITLCCPAQPV